MSAEVRRWSTKEMASSLIPPKLSRMKQNRGTDSESLSLMSFLCFSCCRSAAAASGRCEMAVYEGAVGWMTETSTIACAWP